MVRACAAADIIVSDRRLPRGCNPRWLKADRAFLRRSGGFSIRFGTKPTVETVADRVGRHPWVPAAADQARFAAMRDSR
jgi:competence protein ComEC